MLPPSLPHVIAMPTPRRNPSRAANRPSNTVKNAHAPVLRFRMRVSAGDVIAVGPGKIALLEAIDRVGSITAAAKSLAMSYRRAWLLIEELNHSLREPAVASAKGGAQGGGTALTDVGRELIALYRRIEDTALSANRRDIARLMALLAR